MTRLDRIIEVFKDYDDLVEAMKNSDGSQYNEIKELRDRVAVLAGELIQHGCRRKK